MFSGVKKAIAEILSVPPEPEPPFGADGSLVIFQAAGGYLKYKLATWALSQLAASIGLVVTALFLMGDSFAPDWLPRGVFRAIRGFNSRADFFWVFDSVVITVFLVQLPISWLLVFLDYEYRWYMITDRSLRIREGIWNLREQTMTFSNIQNVEIRRGPLQRLFGIADLEVRTAGGGSTKQENSKSSGESQNLHVGYFRGLEDATEIRELIMKRLRGAAGSGLGDPDERHEAQHHGRDEAISAATLELLTETRALRQSIAASRG